MIAITAGDPCGIGPEILLKALARASRLPHPLIVIGSLRVFEQTAARLRRPLPAWRVAHPDAPWPIPQPRVLCLDVGSRSACEPGRSSVRAGRASLAYLDQAIALWRTGRLRALVTGPVTKWAIQATRATFVGQTEYLAHAMGRRSVVMMFVSDHLRIVLLTRHLPLERVGAAITRPLLRRTLQLTAQALATQFGIRRPRVALCSVNPHAGEGPPVRSASFGEAERSHGGGREEREVMRPVLRSLRRRGLACEGPFAADGFFAARDRMGDYYDAVVCAYHDQGLIPFKLMARDRGCQMTIGLPIVRTSVDHGSALDIAGRGIANPGSMIYAIALATKLARAVHSR